MRIIVIRPNEEPETLSWTDFMLKYQVDYIDLIALKRGHTLNYPDFTTLKETDFVGEKENG